MAADQWPQKDGNSTTECMIFRVGRWTFNGDPQNLRDGVSLDEVLKFCVSSALEIQGNVSELHSRFRPGFGANSSGDSRESQTPGPEGRRKSVVFAPICALLKSLGAESEAAKVE
jgi:hypothetical protein